MTETTTKSRATIRILETSSQVGEAAATDVATELRVLLSCQPIVRMILAAAPSQAALLHALGKAEGVDWSRVEAFHMDEYVGPFPGSPQLFGEWLKREFFTYVPLGKVHLLHAGNDPEIAADNYAALLAEFPIDIVCLGIGMNGHLAFNDPPADFNESNDVRIVELDMDSRIQQVKEGLFRELTDVPTHAITLSIPRLLRAKRLYCCVSGTLKTKAVTRAFTEGIHPSSPASILRTHAGCTVYLDTEAAAGLLPQGC